MQFTIEWLNKYLYHKNSFSIDSLEKTLSSIGLEVEEIIDNITKYNQFIIAEVEEVTQHPNAEKLKLCKIFDGQKSLNIICGARNVQSGMKVVLAPIGSIIPANNMMIKASKIRGIDSEGMLCSANELSINLGNIPQLNLDDCNLSSIIDGIIELPQNADVGKSFAEFANLNNITISIGLTPNRRLDASCVRGIARDISTSGLGEFRDILNIGKYNNNHDIKVLESFDNVISNNIQATIQTPDLCKEIRFSLIKNVQLNLDNVNHNNSHYLLDIEEQENIENYPETIEKTEALDITKQLSAIGHNSSLALVSISNFAMFDSGRPNHIYDADKIEGKISIRLSLEGEIFNSLHGIEYSLPSDILVIADEKKILSIAGVMGGEESKVTEYTRNILTEVAHFDKDAVCRAGRLLNIQSDSRYRFEGGIDLSIGEKFENYLTTLIQKNCKGELIERVCLYGNKIDYVEEIELNIQSVEEVLGHYIEDHIILKILQNLGFIVHPVTQLLWKVIIPHHRRGDINIEEDVIEEIVRIYGINNIPSKRLEINSISHSNSRITNIRNAKQVLCARGMMEVLTWSFIDPDDYSYFQPKYQNQQKSNDTNRLTNSDTDHYKPALDNTILKLDNPISKDMCVMRSSIIPSHMIVAAANLNRNQKNIALFECAKIYTINLQQEKSKDQKNKRQLGNYITNNDEISDIGVNQDNNISYHNIKENWSISALRIGNSTQNNLHNDIREWDFFDIKTDVMSVLSQFHISDKNEEYEIKCDAPSYYHPGRSAAIFFNKKIIAYCGEIHPIVCKKYDINRALAFEIFIDNLPKNKANSSKSVCTLSRFQGVQRDIAFIIDNDLPSIDVLKAAYKAKAQYKNGLIINNIELFDVHYSSLGETLGENSLVANVNNEISKSITKSVALRLNLQALTHTLSYEEIQLAIQAVIDGVIFTCNAKVRDGN